ncbi:putative protein C9.08c [Ceratocystis platani]|uniref:3-oxo-5-alpha-steroid 4-dehydrogenase C-terminal domain-containing protein n=1 Tax=Ceratocystis fimbriata f. sp. platani TaxID=88771 RepID=A0A0F8B2Q7_CERFI|nr:putative protein C9.08c [Ceratocystis platani]
MLSADDLVAVVSSEWLPPTRDNWQLISSVFAIVFPVLGMLQFAISWYGMGKTSVNSLLNIPGRWAWLTMEVPGFLSLSYTMTTLPERLGLDDLPWQNKVLGALFVCNGISIGGWLGGYGPTTARDWMPHSWSTAQFVAGIALFYIGLMGNFFHDEELREIRRAERRKRERINSSGGRQLAEKDVDVHKHYRVPEAMLFKWILYPHYLCEWIEWLGFWIAAGFGCAPARSFLVNEVMAMFPRAWNGRKWYENEFGEEKIRRKWTILPGLC